MQVFYKQSAPDTMLLLTRGGAESSAKGRVPSAGLSAGQTNGESLLGCLS